MTPADRAAIAAMLDVAWMPGPCRGVTVLVVGRDAGERMVALHSDGTWAVWTGRYDWTPRLRGRDWRRRTADAIRAAVEVSREGHR